MALLLRIFYQLLSITPDFIINFFLKHAEFDDTILISSWMTLLIQVVTPIRKNSSFIGILVPIFVALFSRTGILILLESWRNDPRMVNKKVISILLNAAAWAMFFLISWRFHHRVSYFSVNVALCILNLDFLIHLHQVHLALLFLVLFHELFEHLFHVLLALLLDVFLNEFINFSVLAILVLTIGLNVRIALGYTILLLLSTFTLAPLSLLRTFLSLIATDW